MAEINVGDKVRLKKDIVHTTTFKENDEIYKTHQITWKAGSIHTVEHIALGYIRLNDVDIIVKVCNVEKVEEFYTGKVVCVCWPKQARELFTVGKVYEINNGVISCNDMTKLPKIKKLDELNNNPDMTFIEIKNPEALKNDEYYNGKVICISNYGCDEGYWTCGKIYKFKDGIVRCDNGATSPLSGDKIKSYDELKEHYHSMFLEIKE